MSGIISKAIKGTRSVFRKPRPTGTSTIPPPIEPPVQTREQPNKPEEHDRKAKEDQPIDDTLIPPEKPVREKLVKADNKAKEGQSSTEPHTTSDNQTAEGIYHIAWRPEANYRMIAEHFPETNFYVPNAMAMFSLLEAAETRINASKHIQQHEPNYNPYAVKLYYAYMYYIQILRARFDSGHIEGFENSLLKRFSTKYDMKGNPCAEIVYGFFNTIISTELSEAKYDWIVPRIAHTFATNTALADTPITNGAVFLQPLIPHMIGVLNSFIHQTTTTLDAHMEDSDTYIPVMPDTNANDAANIFDTALVNNTTAGNNMKVLLRGSGLSTPFRFGNQNYPTAARHARRTDFGRDINIVTTNTDTDGRNGLTNQFTYSSLDDFLLMPKSSNLRFFSYLRDNAIIHARFFDTVYFFSDVQTTGGLESTVIAQLKLGRSHATRSYTTTSVNTGNSISWYNNPFNDLQAGFATNRAGLRRNEELQAFAYATNSLLPITGVDLLQGQGTFWENREWIQTLYLDTPNRSNVPTVANLTNTGKPMYTDHGSMVLRCFREKPHGTGIADNEYD